jgi:hypothetical protein
MFSVNYAMQKLVTDEKVDLDGKIVDYLGAEFVTETEILPYKYLFANKEVQQFVPDIETIKKWKAELTIRVLASGGINHKQPKRISQFWIRRNSQCHSHSLLIC